MKVYWYWPHPHRAASPVAAEIQSAGHQLVVHALEAYGGESLKGELSYPVVRNLPDPVVGGVMPLRSAKRVATPLQRCARRRKMLSQGFDVAHVETLTYEIDAFDLRSIARRTPVVARVHDIVPHVRRLPEFAERFLWSGVYRSGATLLVDHQVLANQLQDEFGVPPEQIQVVPLPVGERPPLEARPKERFSLLMLGSLRANKGLGLVLEAMRLLPFDAFELTVAGTGDPALAAQVRSAAASSRNVMAEITRFSDDRKWELLERCDAVVMPYTSFASQSGVLLDAYAAGRQVLVTDVGALGPTVRADGTGEVVTADAEQLAEAALRMAARPIGFYSAALRAAAETRSPRNVAHRLLAAYSSAVGHQDLGA